MTQLQVDSFATGVMFALVICICIAGAYFMGLESGKKHD